MKLFSTIALAGALAGSACSYLDRSPSRRDFRISTAEVTRGDIVATVSAIARLEPVEAVTIGAQASGRVVEVMADFNSIVRRGDVLARLDPATEQTRVDQARANLTRAQTETARLTTALADARRRFGRLQRLRAQRIVPQSDLDTGSVAVQLAEAQLRAGRASETQARATLDQRLVDLQHTVIRAPMDGVIVSRSVEVGQTIAARVQAPVLFTQAARLTAMRAVADINQSDVGKVRAGQPVHFRVDAYPSEEFTGTVSQVRLASKLSRNVVTYPTVIDVPNEQRRLRPGMTAAIDIRVASRNDVIRVPESATRFEPTPDTIEALGDHEEKAGEGDDGGLTATIGDQPATTAESPAVESADTAGDEVWVLRDGEIVPVDVELGINDGQQVELVEGDLHPGDEVVWNVIDPDVRVRPEPRWSDFFRQPGRRRR